MDAISSFLSFFSLVLGGQASAVVLFLVFLPIFFFAYWAVKRGAQFSLRPISGFAVLKGLLSRAAEAGQPVHLSLGTAGIADVFTADTMAGFEVLEYLADRAAISASPPIVTMSNPTALPVAQDLLRRAYRRHGYAEEYDPTRGRFIAPDPNLYTNGSSTPTNWASGSPDPATWTSVQNNAFAYAAGAMQLLNDQKLIANVMVGQFGDEFLLLSETGAAQNLNQIGGTSSYRVLPFVYTSVTHPLIGEEIYAGGAYLSDKPAHLSSLFAQDVMRWTMVGTIIVAVLLKTFGVVP